MSDSKKPKKRHLGKGLEALLGPINSVFAEEPKQGGDVPKFPVDKELRESLSQLPIPDIRPNPYQPRHNWNEQDLADLAESIKANGVIQPIIVRSGTYGYEVIAGERRLRAAESAGLEKIPALVRNASDEEMLELALIENIHRADLNPIERALAYKSFVEKFELTQAEAAQRLGEDRSVLTNYLRLLELPDEIRQMLIDCQLSMGHARAILGLPTDELRRKLANKAMAGRLSVREVERLVRRYVEGKKNADIRPEKAAYIIDLETKLREILGTKVQINTRKKGNRGKIIIDFYSLDEFDRITERMGLDPAGQ